MLKNLFWLLVGLALLFVALPWDMGWLGDRVADFDTYKWVPIEALAGIGLVVSSVVRLRKK